MRGLWFPGRIIAGHDHAACVVVSEQRADSRDQAIGRGSGDEVVPEAPPPLCGDRKRAVFNERIVHGKAPKV